nr:hypothetical protein Iba_chr02bCG3010 [Ipomoea batatas]
MECDTDTNAANFAPFPFPAPNSFATLTLVPAKKPRGIISSQPLMAYHIDKASTAILAFSKFPVITIKIL